MPYFERTIKPSILRYLENKDSLVIILYGPRQAGKTTLMRELLKGKEADTLWLDGDDLENQKNLSYSHLEHLKNLVGGKKFLAVDEGQRVENLGLSLKLLVDNMKIKIIVSGSSSFDLAKKINEPLTGRSYTYWVYPLSAPEITKIITPALSPLGNQIESWLRFGQMPKVRTMQSNSEREDYLRNYTNNYLYKDILALESVRKPKIIVNLLSLLALQIGSLVSVHELANNLNISRQAVEKYLDIMEKMFVIYNLRGFSRNLRKEVAKTSKYYFYDLGLRNSLIRNFNEMAVRQDAGQLWENFFVMEKLKSSNNNGMPANFYFWRTYDQKEIDLIQERSGELTGYEAKWGGKTFKQPVDFLTAYPQSKFFLVNKENFRDYL